MTYASIIAGKYLYMAGHRVVIVTGCVLFIVAIRSSIRLFVTGRAIFNLRGEVVFKN